MCPGTATILAVDLLWGPDNPDSIYGTLELEEGMLTEGNAM